MMIKTHDSSNYYLRVHVQDGESEVPADLGDKIHHSRSRIKKQEKEKSHHSKSTIKKLRKENPEEDLEPMNRSLQVTTDEKEASSFFLIPVDDTEDDEFYVVYYQEDLSIEGGRYIPPHSKKSIPYYLHAKRTLFGWKDSRSLRFTSHPSKNCEFRLVRSVTFRTGAGSSLVKDAQEESIYIRCPRHWSRTSYVCMFIDEDEHPSMGCTRSIATRKDESYYFLFNFTLVKPPSAENDDRNPLQDRTASLHREREPSSQALEAPVALHQ